MKFARTLKYYYLKILRLRDEPKRVALSIAVGTSIMFLPFFGLGIFIAYFAALLLKINRIAAVLTTIFWKWAIVGFYTLNYIVGKAVLGKYMHITNNALKHAHGFFPRFGLHNFGPPFLVGSVINAILSGILVYYVALQLLKLRKARKKKRRRKILIEKGE